jgi:glycine/D-amino acid oxidase-like deaminating enzyme
MLNVIIIGAGINGVTAAVELRQRGHKVILIDPGPLPHPLAASTDISKAIRAAYGADEEYTALAERSIGLWRKWNEEFDVPLYHEVGDLFLRQAEMEPGDFEYESLRVFEQRGRKFERVTSAMLRQRFPAWNAERYPDGIFDPEGGYAESGRVVAALIERAKSSGVELREGAAFSCLDENANRIKGVVLTDGQRIAGDMVLAAAGAWTPSLLPFTKTFFRATGHAVFHLKPAQPDLFASERFPVFGADITRTGYYGFPLNRDGVVKIANHGVGREMSPDSAARTVTPEEERNLREFLSWTFPALVDAPIVETRVCLYCDTNDGDFWISRDPERPGLIVAAGDNGHGFKFAPVLGELIADAVEDKPNPLLKKFRWRPEVGTDDRKEAARFRSANVPRA